MGEGTLQTALLGAHCHTRRVLLTASKHAPSADCTQRTLHDALNSAHCSRCAAHCRLRPSLHCTFSALQTAHTGHFTVRCALFTPRTVHRALCTSTPRPALCSLGIQQGTLWAPHAAQSAPCALHRLHAVQVTHCPSAWKCLALNRVGCHSPS